MTLRAKAKLTTKIRRYIKQWLPILSLEDWELELCFVDAPVQEDPEGGWVTYAHCEPSWEYSSALITFYLESLNTLTDAEIERWVVHELSHIIVSEMREQDAEFKHEERVVRNITKAFIRLHYKD